MPQGPEGFRFACCQSLAVALAQADRPTVVIMIKSPDRKRSVPYYTVSAADKDGRLLASCRHELGPFDGLELVERVSTIAYLAWERS